MDIPPLNDPEIKTVTSDQPENKSVIDIKYIIISFLAVLIVGIGAVGVWYMTNVKNTASGPSASLPVVEPTAGTSSSRSSSALRRSSSSSSAADVSAPDSISLGSPDADLQDLQKDLQSL